MNFINSIPVIFQIQLGALLAIGIVLGIGGITFLIMRRLHPEDFVYSKDDGNTCPDPIPGKTSSNPEGVLDELTGTIETEVASAKEGLTTLASKWLSADFRRPGDAPPSVPPPSRDAIPVAAEERSEFDGSLVQLIGWSLLGYLITLFTLGICYPWALCMIYGWRINHTIINGRRLKFTGSAIGLFAQWIKWLILTFITLGIYGLWLGIKLEQWKVSHTTFAKSKSAPNPTELAYSSTPATPQHDQKAGVTPFVTLIEDPDDDDSYGEEFEEMYPGFSYRIPTKIVGVSFKNDDGSDRQEYIASSLPGEELFLEDCSSLDHPEAIGVFDSARNQLGNIKKGLAGQIRRKYIDTGKYTLYSIRVFILDVTGGDGDNYGCNIILLFE